MNIQTQEALKMAIEALDFEIFLKYTGAVLIPLGLTFALITLMIVFIDGNKK